MGHPKGGLRITGCGLWTAWRGLGIRRCGLWFPMGGLWIPRRGLGISRCIIRVSRDVGGMNAKMRCERKVCYGASPVHTNYFFLAQESSSCRPPAGRNEFLPNPAPGEDARIPIPQNIQFDSFRFILIQSDSVRSSQIHSDSFRFIQIHSDSVRFSAIQLDAFRRIQIQ